MGIRNKIKFVKIVLVIFFSVISFADDYINLNQDGIKYLEFGEYDTAIEKFNQAIQLNPNLPTAYNNLGKVYAKQGNTDKALETFNKVLGLNPDFVPTLRERGKLHTSMEKWEQALADYNKLLELDSDFAPTYHNRGRIYVELEEFEKAIIDYNQALKLDVGLTAILKIDKDVAFAEIENRRGLKYLYQNDDENAKEYFERALNLVPEFVKARNNLGLVYLHFAYIAETKDEFVMNAFAAIAAFDRAVFLDPNFEAAYNNRGMAYLRLRLEPMEIKEQHRLALADFNRALELNPNYAEALFNRGVLYNMIGETDKAVADYSQGLSLKPMDIAYYERGSIYSKIGQYDEAIADYTHALRLNPVAETYNARGDTYILIGGKNFEAIEDYILALKSVETGALLGLSREGEDTYTDAYLVRGDRSHKRPFFGTLSSEKRRLRATIRKNLKTAETLMRRQTRQTRKEGLLYQIGNLCRRAF